MKSILFYIARYPGYGGIENITTLLANYFASKKNYKVSILSCTQQAEEELITKLDKYIQFYKLPNNTVSNTEENQKFFNQIIIENSIDTIIYQDSYYPNEILLLNIINRNQITIICVEHTAPDSGIKTMKSALRATSWYNLYLHAKICYFHGLGIRKTQKRKQKLYAFCDKYVVLSLGYKSIFLKMNNIEDSNKIVAIENPISLPILKEMPQKEKVCLFVGRFSSEKGILYLLRIWKKIEENKDCDEWKLIMVGDGAKKNEVESFIKKNNLKRIQLEGFKTHVNSYYQKASIFCMTSIFEGFPLTLPEAMGNGVVPIAFSSFAASADIIDNNQNGILIPPYNEMMYIQRITTLMTQTKERERLASNALKKSYNFTQELIWEKWNKLLEQ